MAAEVDVIGAPDSVADPWRGDRPMGRGRTFGMGLGGRVLANREDALRSGRLLRLSETSQMFGQISTIPKEGAQGLD